MLMIMIQKFSLGDYAFPLSQNLLSLALNTNKLGMEIQGLPPKKLKPFMGSS